MFLKVREVLYNYLKMRIVLIILILLIWQKIIDLINKETKPIHEFSYKDIISLTIKKNRILNIYEILLIKNIYTLRHLEENISISMITRIRP